VHTIFRVEFGVHVPEDSVASMVTGITSHGLLSREGNSRRYVIDVQRPARAAKLKEDLQSWERYGFLKWQAQPQVED
jgi:hypothetical protein